MATGFTESVTVDEGINEQGVGTKLHFESDGGLVIQKTFDAEPILKWAEQARQQTQGMGWGNGRIVGRIDAADYPRIAAIKDRQERDKAILEYFREKPKYVAFDSYYKTLFGVKK